MSDIRHQSLFFSSLPELWKLYAVKVTVSSQLAETEIRTKQWKMCKQLLLLFEGVLSSPIPGTLNQISVILTIPLYKSGTFQAYTAEHGAIVGMPERVTPGIFQICLSYTLRAKLAPNWNQAGHLLIQGRDFLSKMGKQNAVVMDINVSETQLCISVEAYRIRLPPPKLEDFDISANITKNFDNDNCAVIPKCDILSNWCYVLPSMKMGQILNISHIIPPDSPFQSYNDLQLHWESLYGYILPEDSQKFVSIYFKLIGEQLFTYPFNCIRSQPVQYFPKEDLEAILKSFVTDLKTAIPHICGFPLKITQKALYSTKDFTQASVQKINSKEANLTARRNYKEILNQVVLKTDDENTGIVGHKDCNRKQQKRENSVLTLKSNESVKLSTTFSKRDSTRIIPIFKGKLLEMDRQFTKKINAKKRLISHDLPEITTANSTAKLAVLKPSADQVNKLLHDASFKNIANRSVLQIPMEKNNIRSAELAVKEENKNIECLLAKRAVLVDNSSKIRSRKLNSSLTSPHNQSKHFVSTVHQHLNKTATVSAGQSQVSIHSEKSGKMVKGNSRIFLKQIQKPTEETKTNSYKLTSSMSKNISRKESCRALAELSNQDIIKTSRPYLSFGCQQEEEGCCTRPKKPKTKKPSN